MGNKAPFCLTAAMIGLVTPSVSIAQAIKPTPPTAPAIETPATKQNNVGVNTAYEKQHEAPCAYSDKDIVENRVLEPLDSTDMVGLYPCWLADEDEGKSRDLSDYYTHWSIRHIRNPKGSARGYQYETRDKFLRLIIGRDLSMLATLRIEMRDPDTTIVLPLVSYGYQGRAGKPEFWSTELTGDNQSSSFFRIESSTSANINLKASSTNAVEVRAGGTIISALTGIASIANPGTGLLTNLNKDSIQQTSKALDNALSNIWSNSRAEVQSSGRALSEWKPGVRYILKVTIPGWVRPKSYDRSKTKDEQRFVRWYELTLSCPRLSVFSSTQYCNAGSDLQAERAIKERALRDLRNTVSAEQVINFKLSSGKRLQEHLASFDWYGRFLRLAGSPGGKPKETSAPADSKAVENENSADITSTVPEQDAKIKLPAPPAGDKADAAPPIAALPNGPQPAIQKPDTQSTVRTRLDADYASLCNSIVNELYAVGLSKIDSQIGLWAIISASSDFVGTAADFNGNATCTRRLPLAGYKDVWWFASSPTAEQNSQGTPAAKADRKRQGTGKGKPKPKPGPR